MTTVGDHVVVFSGTRHEYEDRNLRDTWVLLADTWRKLRLDPRPAGRHWSSFAWDSVRGEAVLYGGTTWYGEPALQDTWVLTP